MKFSQTKRVKYSMIFKENPDVLAKINGYPEDIQAKLFRLRELIVETGREIEGLEVIEETLKWGEASYLSTHGSTIRMDWKSTSPDQYALYFHCQTKLIETFKELHGNKFQFDGNRAIVFQRNEEIAENELKHCLSLALNYHKVKNLDLLGA